MNKITAIIPVRQFDYKINNKNLLSFCDTNLLVYKINQLKKVKAIDEIIVCADYDEALVYAKENNVTTYKRKSSNEGASLSDLVCEMMSVVKSSDILWVNCCTPLINENIYEDAINVYYQKKKEKYDSLISVSPFKRYLLDDNGPVNFRKGVTHKETANLSQFYILVSGIFIASSKDMAKWKYNWGNIPYKYALSEEAAIEIKDLKDLKIAEILQKEMYKNGL